MAKEKPNPVSRQESLKDADLKVVSPLGEVTIEEGTMAPRLDTLEGKTICLTGVAIDKFVKRSILKVKYVT